MKDISTQFAGPIAPPSAQELADRYAIGQLVKVYALGVDTRNIKLMRTVFSEDAVCEGSVWKGSADEYLPKMLEGTAPFWSTQHAITNQHILFSDPDNAEMWSFCIAFHAGDRGKGQDDLTVGALYMDTVKRFPNGWQIVYRNAKLLYVTGAFEFPDQLKSALVDFVKPPSGV